MKTTKRYTLIYIAGKPDFWFVGFWTADKIWVSELGCSSREDAVSEAARLNLVEATVA